MIKCSVVISQDYRQTIDVRIPFQTTLINIEGKLTAYYELYVTNFSTDTLDIIGIKIKDKTNSSIYLSANSAKLLNITKKIGSPNDKHPTRLIPGQTSVIYLEYDVSNDKIPIDITHIITLKNLTDAKEYVEKGSLISLSNREQIIVGAPLSGGPWAAIYDPSWDRGHRRVIYTINGKARIPGRYAIDFIKMDSLGKYSSAQEDTIKNWYGYGENVLAVADGIISSIATNFDESECISKQPKTTPDKAAGNYVSIKIGKSQFVFYEHLKPGSIKVKPGQKVKRGQVIAQIGFTGQTTGPHLHIHLADTDAALGAEGLPFAFKHFETIGIYSDFSGFGKNSWTKITKTQKANQNERPLPNSVIYFK